MSKSAEKALKVIYLEARAFKSQLANSGHLLLALLKDSENLVSTLLGDAGVNYVMVKTQMQEYKQPKSKSEYPENEDDDQDDPFSKKQNPGAGKRVQIRRLKPPYWTILGLTSPGWPKKTAWTPL